MELTSTWLAWYLLYSSFLFAFLNYFFQLLNVYLCGLGNSECEIKPI